jgi:TldD protein
MTSPRLLDPNPFADAELDFERLPELVGRGLAGVDDGELFLEYRETESFAFDDGRLKSAAFDVSRGLGLRAVAGEAIGLAHSRELSTAALGRAIDAVGAVKAGYRGELALPPQGTNRKRYGEANPIHGQLQAAKVGLLEQIDAYARAKDRRVRQVSASLGDPVVADLHAESARLGEADMVRMARCPTTDQTRQRCHEAAILLVANPLEPTELNDRVLVRPGRAVS